MVRQLLVACMLVSIAAGSLFAQRGDRKGHVMKEVWRDMVVPPAPPLSPADALTSFKVAPGFRVELVAAEPMVENPVAMTWDADGRLWVVNMRAYMPDVDGAKENSKIGNVVVLEDTNNDGQMDKRTTFLDGLEMPRAVAMVQGGVLISEPPTLWYCQDTDGDLVCDKKVKVANYAKQGPVEHTENGLMYGLDNWMYNAKSNRRFKFRDGKIIDDPTAFRGQWGMAKDNYGRLYFTTNSAYLMADLVPYEYLKRNRSYEAKLGTSARIYSDSSLWTIRVNPGINRGYMGGMLRDDGRLAKITGISAPEIYRGDQYPADYVGMAFIPEPCGNVMTLHKVKEDGIKLSTERLIYDDPKWKKREFWCSTDERFRPVSTYTGPDGCMYAIDLYHGIVQHKVYVTTFLRKQIIERKLDQPLYQGRIYRIVHEGKKPGTTMPKLSAVSNDQLVKHLSHANGWYRDTAQRLLIERDAQDVIASLRSAATNADSHLGRIHALWTLNELGGIDAATAIAALSDKHPKVQIAALRTAESLLKDKVSADVVAAMAKLADSKDESVLVQLAFTLGEGKGDLNAENAMVTVLKNHASNNNVRLAMISGVGGREAMLIQKLLIDEEWLTKKDGYTEVLQMLATSGTKSRNAGSIELLLALVAVQPKKGEWCQTAVLTGMTKAASSKWRPVSMKVKPGSLSLLASSKNKSLPKLVKTIESKVITWSGNTAEIARPNVKPLTAEQQKLFTQGKSLYMASCIACHQVTGEGLPGQAPPLVDTEYVLGNPERIARIVLQGLMGPIKVNGEDWNLIMPGHQFHPMFTGETQAVNEKVAGLLTYIRREWGHTADPVSPELIGKVREATKGRVQPWTIDELNKAVKGK